LRLIDSLASDGNVKCLGHDADDTRRLITEGDPRVENVLASAEVRPPRAFAEDDHRIGTGP
jgi:hypothetical protein